MKTTSVIAIAALVTLGLGLPAQGLTGVQENPVDQAPGPQAWVDAARSSQPLTIDAGPATLDLALSENTDLFASGATVHDASGQPVDTSDIHPLTGTVVGVPGSWVAATASGDFLTGTIVVPGAGTLQIGQLEDGSYGVVDATELPSLGRTFEAPGSNVVPDAPVRGHATMFCSQFVPHHVANPTGRVLGYSTQLAYDVSFSVDDAFTNQYSNWATVATSYINAGDAFYQATENVRIVATDLHSHSGAFPSGDTAGLLEDAKSHYNSAHTSLSRDGTHVFTGKNTGTAVGQANCIGGAGDPAVAYTVSMGAHLDSFQTLGFSFLTDAYVKVFTHEVGHILSAHHHYANCVESLLVYDPLAPTEACTLMINAIDAATLSWSTVNEATTRGWAEDAGL